CLTSPPSRHRHGLSQVKLCRVSPSGSTAARYVIHMHMPHSSCAWWARLALPTTGNFVRYSVMADDPQSTISQQRVDARLIFLGSYCARPEDWGLSILPVYEVAFLPPASVLRVRYS